MNGHILADRDNNHIMFDTEDNSGPFNNLLISDHLPVFMELKNATDSAVLNKNSNEQKKLVLNDFIISVEEIKKNAPNIFDDNKKIINDKEYINKMSDYVDIIIKRDYDDLNYKAKEKLKNLYNNMNSIRMKKDKPNIEAAIEFATKNTSITKSLKAINKAIKSTQKQGGKRRTRRRSRRSRRSTHRKKKMSRRKRNTRKRR